MRDCRGSVQTEAHVAWPCVLGRDLAGRVCRAFPISTLDDFHGLRTAIGALTRRSAMLNDDFNGFGAGADVHLV